MVAAKQRRNEVPIEREPVIAERVSRKIVRPTAVELVTAAIRQRILSGDLAPGEVLRQEALAEELGVSRVPVREAITRLRAEGMINVVASYPSQRCARPSTSGCGSNRGFSRKRFPASPRLKSAGPNAWSRKWTGPTKPSGGI